MSTSKLLFPMRSIGYIMAGEKNTQKRREKHRVRKERFYDKLWPVV